jgi:hypothetical protein
MIKYSNPTNELFCVAVDDDPVWRQLYLREAREVEGLTLSVFSDTDCAIEGLKKIHDSDRRIDVVFIDSLEGGWKRVLEATYAPAFVISGSDIGDRVAAVDCAAFVDKNSLTPGFVGRLLFALGGAQAYLDINRPCSN